MLLTSASRNWTTCSTDWTGLSGRFWNGIGVGRNQPRRRCGTMTCSESWRVSGKSLRHRLEPWSRRCGPVCCAARVYNFSSMPEHIKKKLQDEINVLEHELSHELPKELKKAVALGDLSENAEYHMAKQRQEFVKARLRQLGRRLADLSLINMNNIPKDKIGLGSTVRVYDNVKNEEMEYKLVTSEESDVNAGKISTTSPT